mgnify:CR=1 FL=1
MNGVQPCDFASSPVSSYILRFSHPITPGPTTPALVHSVWLASSANCRWCVGKHVLISVNRRYKVPDSGFRIVGRDSWGAP